jgi:hypothetical protein
MLFLSGWSMGVPSAIWRGCRVALKPPRDNVTKFRDTVPHVLLNEAPGLIIHLRCFEHGPISALCCAPEKMHLDLQADARKPRALGCLHLRPVSTSGSSGSSSSACITSISSPRRLRTSARLAWLRANIPSPSRMAWLMGSTLRSLIQVFAGASRAVGQVPWAGRRPRTVELREILISLQPHRRGDVIGLQLADKCVRIEFRPLQPYGLALTVKQGQPWPAGRPVRPQP